MYSKRIITRIEKGKDTAKFKIPKAAGVRVKCGGTHIRITSSTRRTTATGSVTSRTATVHRRAPLLGIAEHTILNDSFHFLEMTLKVLIFDLCTNVIFDIIIFYHNIFIWR